jgi:hypothetical protein
VSRLSFASIRSSIEVTGTPPFCDEVERYRGLKFGSEFLSVAV